MSLESVRAFLNAKAPDLHIIDVGHQHRHGGIGG